MRVNRLWENFLFGENNLVCNSYVTFVLQIYYKWYSMMGKNSLVKLPPGVFVLKWLWNHPCNCVAKPQTPWQRHNPILATVPYTQALCRWGLHGQATHIFFWKNLVSLWSSKKQRGIVSVIHARHFPTFPVAVSLASSFSLTFIPKLFLFIQI